MITAEQLKVLTAYDVKGITMALRNTGYKSHGFVDVEFMGLTNGRQFCYKAMYLEDGVETSTKVFLNYDPATAKLTADY